MLRWSASASACRYFWVVWICACPSRSITVLTCPARKEPRRVGVAQVVLMPRRHKHDQGYSIPPSNRS